MRKYRLISVSRPEDKELKDKTHSFEPLNRSATILDVVTK